MIDLQAKTNAIMKKKEALGAMISTGSFGDFIEGIFRLAEEKKSSYVCFANVHMLIEAHKDRQFGEILNNADIVAPDGRPVSIFLNLFHKTKQERVPGMDLMPALLREAAKRNTPVYFYGSTPKILDLIAQRARKELPALKIAGMRSPPFRELSEEEREEIVRNINLSGARLVFVALGCPKQEKWMAKHRGKINACMLGVGQAYNVYAGVEKRLPPWMRNLSLEWLYRLYLEPRRLWKRYLISNTLFLWLTFKHALKTAFGQGKG